MKPGPEGKNNHELTNDQTTDTAEKSRTHLFKILNTANTICGENCENIMGSKVYKPRNINVLPSQ
jgi:hypothetical protein